MSKIEREALLNLAKADSLGAAEESVQILEKKCGYGWRPVGDNEANYGLINLGSDPGHALIERITNAIDAVIERESLRQSSKHKLPRIPATPRECSTRSRLSSDKRVKLPAIVLLSGLLPCPRTDAR